MHEQGWNLSPKTIAVLEMISAGCSYEQILAAYPDITYLDIFEAATEALDFASSRSSSPISQPASPTDHVSDIRRSYPRAYEKWTDGEEDRLRALINRGHTVAQIAGRLQRQRSAIRSRIIKLDLVGELSPKEQARLAHISKLDPAKPDPSVD